MRFEDLSKGIEQLSYREKLHLAQRLIQLARKEEEEQNPNQRQPAESQAKSDPELIQYVADRLRKLKPSNRDAIYNSIGAMFQFRGGISEVDKQRLFSELQKRRHLVLGKDGRVQYPEV
jgi:hypothetical protein